MVGNIMAKILGRHLIVELEGCESELLDNIELIKKILGRSAKAAKLKVIAKPILHKFKPRGVAGALLLQLSHITIHTWPEFGYAAVDIFVCGKFDAHKVLKIFKNNLKPKSVRVKEIFRGPRK